jgi:hypothetical protein
MMMKLAASALSAFSPPPWLLSVGNFAQGGSTVDVDDGYLFRDV